MSITSPRLKAAALAAVLAAGGALLAPGSQAQTQDRNCVDVLAGDPQFLRTMNGVLMASMEGVFRNEQNITIFAPTNEAVNSVNSVVLSRYFPAQRGSDSSVDPVLGPAAVGAHVAQGRHTTASMGQGANLTSKAGTPLNITRSGTTYTVTGAGGTTATIVQANIPCANGVIHAISRPLLVP